MFDKAYAGTLPKKKDEPSTFELIKKYSNWYFDGCNVYFMRLGINESFSRGKHLVERYSKCVIKTFGTEKEAYECAKNHNELLSEEFSGGWGTPCKTNA